MCSYERTDVYPQDDDDGSGVDLSPGDVVIVAFDSDDPDTLSFVPTVDLVAGTVIKFTDNGWGDDEFREGEGVVRYATRLCVCVCVCACVCVDTASMS